MRFMQSPRVWTTYWSPVDVLSLGPCHSEWPLLPPSAIVMIRPRLMPSLGSLSYCGWDLCWSLRLVLPSKVTIKPRVGPQPVILLESADPCSSWAIHIWVSYLFTYLFIRTPYAVWDQAGADGQAWVNDPAAAGVFVHVRGPCHLRES